MAGKEDVDGLRIGVKRSMSLARMHFLQITIHSSVSGGCSGYSYNMNYVKKGDDTIEKDELVQQHGVNVYVDPKAIFFIVGTEMDFVVCTFLSLH